MMQNGSKLVVSELLCIHVEAVETFMCDVLCRWDWTCIMQQQRQAQSVPEGGRLPRGITYGAPERGAFRLVRAP